jgi:hypothetical protein
VVREVVHQVKRAGRRQVAHQARVALRQRACFVVEGDRVMCRESAPRSAAQRAGQCARAQRPLSNDGVSEKEADSRSRLLLLFSRKLTRQQQQRRRREAREKLRVRHS